MSTIKQDEAWPPLDFEARPWLNAQDVYGSRTQKRRTAGPYLAAAPPFISGRAIPINGELHVLTEVAASELARFDAEVGQIAAPFASSLLSAGSASSSEIENLTSGARQIALAELGERTSRHAQLIVGNVRAMQDALNLAESIDGHAILEMHRALLEQSDPDILGHWRDQQVWIGGGSIGPHTAQFVPPHHERVTAFMDDLVAVANSVDLPASCADGDRPCSIRDHPSVPRRQWQGRSRTHPGDVAKGQLTRNVAVPVSAGLLHDTGRYLDALGAYRSGGHLPDSPLYHRGIIRGGAQRPHPRRGPRKRAASVE